MTYRTQTIEEDDIIRFIQKSQQNIEMIWNGRCKQVIVGPAAYDDAINAVMGSFSFFATVRLRKDREFRVCGLQVHVIPWFDGCLLLPDLEDGKCEP